jgi:aquaporin Z
MLESLERNWREYLMEAVGLAGFVLGAGLLTVLLEHPDLLVMQSSFGAEENAMWRRVPLGILMGAYIAFITRLWSERSGAHINPPVSWSFFRLGKISFTDAVFFTIAHFAGAIAAAQLLKFALGSYFAHPLIDFGITKPKPQHTSTEAFVAEFIISFVLMFVVLVAANSTKLEKKAPLIVGALIAFYLIVEAPYSGMSLNPARSTAAAVAANKYEHLWIYFVAPGIAMLLAAEMFLLAKPIFRGVVDKEQDNFPVEKKEDEE